MYCTCRFKENIYFLIVKRQILYLFIHIVCLKVYFNKIGKRIFLRYLPESREGGRSSTLLFVSDARPPERGGVTTAGHTVIDDRVLSPIHLQPTGTTEERLKTSLLHKEGK